MDRRTFIGSVAGGLFAAKKSVTAAHAVPPIDSSWAGRSTAPGVLLATDFSTDAEVLPYRYANARNQAQFEMVKRAVDDGLPCLQIDIVANNPGGTTQGQAWRRRFRDAAAWPNDGDGIGTQPFWIQFGFKIPASRLVPWLTVDEGGRPWVDGVSTGRKVEYNSWKFAIIANMSISNPFGMADQSSNAISHVLTNKSHRGAQFPVTYAHNNTYTNGSPYEVPMPDGDINLSQGWQGKDGQLCRYSDPRGCPIWPVDQWIWFQYRQHTRTYGGTAGNELDVWWALPGDPTWTPLVSRREYPVGIQTAPWRNGFNAIWLTPFETDRVTPGGVDTWVKYRNLIVSTQEPAFPALNERANAPPSGNIGPGFTGTWYNPAQSGHGLAIEILPDNRFYITWFAFNPLGTQQSWFTGVGTYSGNTATITVVDMPTGGRWIPNFDPRQIVRNAWGTLTFNFTDCNHGTVNFNSMIGYGTGSMNLTRLTQPAGLSCP